MRLTDPGSAAAPQRTQACLVRNSKKRPSADELLEHKWVAATESERERNLPRRCRTQPKMTSISLRRSSLAGIGPGSDEGPCTPATEQEPPANCQPPSTPPGGAEAAGAPLRKPPAGAESAGAPSALGPGSSNSTSSWSSNGGSDGDLLRKQVAAAAAAAAAAPLAGARQNSSGGVRLADVPSAPATPQLQPAAAPVSSPRTPLGGSPGGPGSPTSGASPDPYPLAPARRVRTMPLPVTASMPALNGPTLAVGDPPRFPLAPAANKRAAVSNRSLCSVSSSGGAQPACACGAGDEGAEVQCTCGALSPAPRPTGSSVQLNAMNSSAGRRDAWGVPQKGSTTGDEEGSNRGSKVGSSNSLYNRFRQMPCGDSASSQYGGGPSTPTALKKAAAADACGGGSGEPGARVLSVSVPDLSAATEAPGSGGGCVGSRSGSASSLTGSHVSSSARSILGRRSTVAPIERPDAASASVVEVCAAPAGSTGRSSCAAEAKQALAAPASPAPRRSGWLRALAFWRSS